MESNKQDSPSVSKGGKDGNDGNDKSGGFDLYSFWNTFDPNEISPEPPPEKEGNEPKQGMPITQPNYQPRNSTHQPFPNMTSNIQYNQMHNQSDQNELHKISSAIAASQLSSAVIRKSDSFQNRIYNQFNHPHVSSETNGMRSSNGPFHPESTHLDYFQQISRYHHSKYPNLHDKGHRTPSMSSFQQSAVYNDAHGQRSMPQQSFAGKQMIQHMQQMQQQIQQRQQSLMMDHERYASSIYRGVNPSSHHGLRNPGYHDYRYPFPPAHSRIQNYNHLHEHMPKTVDRQTIQDNRLLSFSHELHSQTVTAQYPQPSSYVPSRSNNYSSNINQYNNQSTTHNSGPINQQIQKKESLSKFSAPQTMVQSNPAKSWENYHKIENFTKQSITAASNQLINNSIIYKNSETRARLSAHGPQSHAAFHEPHSHPVSNIFQRSDNQSQSSTAKIQKPWDFIPKYSMQRDKQHQLYYNSPNVPSVHQSNHSSSTPSNFNQSAKIASDHFNKTSSNLYNPNPSIPYTPTNSEPIPNSSQSSVQQDMSLQYSYQDINTTKIHSHCMERSNHNYPPINSTMNDLIKITDQVLNSDFKYSNVERNEKGEMTEAKNSYKFAPSSFNPSALTKQCSENKSTDGNCQTALTDESGIVCYKCGALVERSTTITDDETTIAVCHKCSEVLYFNKKDNISKTKGKGNEKIIPSQSSDNTSCKVLPEQNNFPSSNHKRSNLDDLLSKEMSTTKSSNHVTSGSLGSLRKSNSLVEERIPTPVITPKDRLRQQRASSPPDRASKIDSVDKEMEKIFNVGMERTNMSKPREAHHPTIKLPENPIQSKPLNMYDDRDFHQVLEDEFMDTNINVDATEGSIPNLSAPNIEPKQYTELQVNSHSIVEELNTLQENNNHKEVCKDNSNESASKSCSNNDLVRTTAISKPFKNSDESPTSEPLTTINQDELWLCGNDAKQNKNERHSTSKSHAEFTQCSDEVKKSIQKFASLNKITNVSQSADMAEAKDFTLFGNNRMTPDLKMSHQPSNVGIVEPRVVLKLKVPSESIQKISENSDKAKNLSTEKLLNFQSDYDTEEEEDDKGATTLSTRKSKKEKKKKKHKKHKKNRSSSCKCENSTISNQSLGLEIDPTVKQRVYCKECGKKKSKKHCNAGHASEIANITKDSIKVENPEIEKDSKRFNHERDHKSIEFSKPRAKVGGFTSVKDEGKIIKMKDYWRHKSMMSPHCSSPSSELFLPRYEEKGYKQGEGKQVAEKNVDQFLTVIESQCPANIVPKTPSVSPFDDRILFTNRMVKAITGTTTFERKDAEDIKRSQSMTDICMSQYKDPLEELFHEGFNNGLNQDYRKPFIKSKSVPSDLHIDLSLNHKRLTFESVISHENENKNFVKSDSCGYHNSFGKQGKEPDNSENVLNAPEGIANKDKDVSIDDYCKPSKSVDNESVLQAYSPLDLPDIDEETTEHNHCSPIKETVNVITSVTDISDEVMEPPVISPNLSLKRSISDDTGVHEETNSNQKWIKKDEGSNKNEKIQHVLKDFSLDKSLRNEDESYNSPRQNEFGRNEKLSKPNTYKKIGKYDYDTKEEDRQEKSDIFKNCLSGSVRRKSFDQLNIKKCIGKHRISKYSNIVLSESCYSMLTSNQTKELMNPVYVKIQLSGVMKGFGANDAKQNTNRKAIRKTNMYVRQAILNAMSKFSNKNNAELNVPDRISSNNLMNVVDLSDNMDRIFDSDFSSSDKIDVTSKAKNCLAEKSNGTISDNIQNTLRYDNNATTISDDVQQCDHGSKKLAEDLDGNISGNKKQEFKQYSEKRLKFSLKLKNKYSAYEVKTRPCQVKLEKIDIKTKKNELAKASKAITAIKHSSQDLELIPLEEQRNGSLEEIFISDEIVEFIEDKSICSKPKSSKPSSSSGKHTSIGRRSPDNSENALDKETNEFLISAYAKECLQESCMTKVSLNIGQTKQEYNRNFKIVDEFHNNLSEDHYQRITGKCNDAKYNTSQNSILEESKNDSAPISTSKEVGAKFAEQLSQQKEELECDESYRPCFEDKSNVLSKDVMLNKPGLKRDKDVHNKTEAINTALLNGFGTVAEKYSEEFKVPHSDLIKTSLKPTNSSKDIKTMKPIYRNSMVSLRSIEPPQKVNHCHSLGILSVENNDSQMMKNIQNTSNQCPGQNNGMENTTDRKNASDNKHNIIIKVNTTSKKGCETQTKPEMTPKEHKSSAAKGNPKTCDLKSKDLSAQEIDNGTTHLCMYCDKSFQSRSSLVQHLHVHIDGNVDEGNPQTTCPVSRSCHLYDASKGALSSHIVECHPEQVNKLELHPNSELPVTADNSMNILERTTNDTSLNLTPICAVKPLPPVSSRLVEDLADTVSAIEAICSLNNEPPSQTIQQTPSTSKYKEFDGNLFTDSNTNPNCALNNDILTSSNSLQNVSNREVTTVNVNTNHQLPRNVFSIAQNTCDDDSNALENTHKAFELAVQSAELIVPESLETSYFLPNTNVMSNNEKHNVSDSQNYSSQLRNSTTRSDIESDSGVESVNSHHFQNSPLYSPMQTINKNYTSPSPSTIMINHERDEMSGDSNISAKEPLNVQKPKQTTISSLGFEAPTFLSNNDFKSNHLDSINAIESNFPDVFGASNQNELPSFSDMIEAETLKMFGDQSGGAHYSDNSFSSNVCSLNVTNDKSEISMSTKCTDTISPNSESEYNGPNQDDLGLTPISKLIPNSENLDSSMMRCTSAKTMKLSLSNSDVKESSNTLEEMAKGKDISKTILAGSTKNLSSTKRKIMDVEENSRLSFKKAKVQDTNHQDPSIPSKHMRNIEHKKLSNKYEQEKNVENVEFGRTEFENSTTSSGNSGIETKSTFQDIVSTEEKSMFASEYANDSGQRYMVARASGGQNSNVKNKRLRPGPKSKVQKLEKISEDEESLVESSELENDRHSTSQPKVEICDNKMKKEAKTEAKGGYFRRELLNELHKSITDDQENCVVARTALIRKNGTKSSTESVEAKKNILKKNEIKSNLLTCIDACFPSLAEQKKKTHSERGPLSKIDSHRKLKASSFQKAKENEVQTKHQHFSSTLSKVNGIKQQTEIQETVKQFSEHLKALRKGHEHDTLTSEKEEKNETVEFITPTKKSFQCPSLFTKDTQNQKQEINAYVCPKCGRKYQYENFLKVHMKRC